MIEQLKELLTEATIHIQHDVNSTQISFSFKEEEIDPAFSITNFEGTNEERADNGPEFDGAGFSEMDRYSEEAVMPLIDEFIEVLTTTKVEKAKKDIEKIVEQSGIPKDNVIIGTVPKAKKEEAPTLLHVETKAEIAIKARYKTLTDLGWTKDDKAKQVSLGGIGLAYTYIEQCSDADFAKAYADIKKNIENSKKMEEERKAKIKRANEIVQQATAESKGKATVTGSLISKEQQELMEEAYAVPDDDIDDLDDIPLVVDDVKYKGEPATPEEAFDVPEVKKEMAPPPPPPINTDMDLIAKNPLEQIKRNQSKPYLNKLDELITPEIKKEIPKEDKQMLWDNLIKKCKANDISTEGINFEDQSVNDIKDLHKWVDETIEEESQK